MQCAVDCGPPYDEKASADTAENTVQKCPQACESPAKARTRNGARHSHAPRHSRRRVNCSSNQDARERWPPSILAMPRFCAPGCAAPRHPARRSPVHRLGHVSATALLAQKLRDMWESASLRTFCASTSPASAQRLWASVRAAKPSPRLMTPRRTRRSKSARATAAPALPKSLRDSKDITGPVLKSPPRLVSQSGRQQSHQVGVQHGRFPPQRPATRASGVDSTALHDPNSRACGAFARPAGPEARRIPPRRSAPPN